MTEINLTNLWNNEKNVNSKEKQGIKIGSLPLQLKNHFVTAEKPDTSLNRSSELGLEYDKDVKTDEQFLQKIFSDNIYNPTSENLIDFCVEIRRMMDEKHDYDTGNAGAVAGGTVFGVFGFFGFAWTMIGAIAGGVVGGAIGGYVGRKLRRKIKKAIPLSQEEIYRTKIECMIQFGKLQKDFLKLNLNKLRILIEKIIEESIHALNLDLFEDKKKMAKKVVKLRDFLVTLEPQKALLLSYKLFKVYLKRQDLEDPASSEEIATKLYNLFILMLTSLR